MIRAQSLLRLTGVSFSTVVLLWLASAPETAAQRDKPMPLDIGASSALTPKDMTPAKEKAALESLKSFIKEQTGLDNEITHEKNWSGVADKLVKGKYQIGVFAGYEFAWAQEKHAKLKPLALAVNSQRYPIACLVVHKDSKASDFAGLRDQSLAVPASCQSLVRLFVEREAQAAGKKVDAYFSKVLAPENTEDALDDVVDGMVGAAAVERVGLDSYKRRKPGRFKQLKELAQSRPFPPVVVAYLEGALDAKTLQRFREGLLGAARKERGEMLLTLFRLTGFEDVPRDFDKVLTETHKAYPPEDGSR
jgi:ABC-type phosphate/phosphonate transport system substrate-binding protein